MIYETICYDACTVFDVILIVFSGERRRKSSRDAATENWCQRLPYSYTESAGWNVDESTRRGIFAWLESNIDCYIQAKESPLFCFSPLKIYWWPPKLSLFGNYFVNTLFVVYLENN